MKIVGNRPTKKSMKTAERIIPSSHNASRARLPGALPPGSSLQGLSEGKRLTKALRLLTFKSFLFLLVMMALLSSRIRVHALLWVMAMSIGFYGVRSGVGAIVTGGGARVWGPPNTMIFDNNHFAVALIVALPLLNHLRMNSEHKVVRFGLVAAMGLFLMAALASYSRGALLGLGAMGLFLWLKSRQKLVPAVVIALAVVAGVLFMPQKWLDRMNTISAYRQDASAEDRIGMWRAATQIALARPLGAGFKGPYLQAVMDRYAPGTTARAVHSIYFECIGEHGFFVFAVWCVFPIIAWRNGNWLIRHTRDSPEFRWANDFARMAQVSSIGYLVGGAFLSLSYWDYYFFIIGILAVVREMVAAAEERADLTTSQFELPAGTPGIAPAGGR